MLETLSSRPDADQLARFVERLLAERSEEIEFIVLFGSMARGDWLPDSDYDVLIGLRRDDHKRLVDRIGEFEALAPGRVEVFPYSLAEWQRMFAEYHPLLLDALEHGVALWDRGEFARMRETFRQWLASGRVRRWMSGWQISAA